MLLAVLAIFVVSAEAAETGSYAVSISNVTASSGEVIVFFHLQVTAGFFVDVSNLPPGWNVAIDNEPSALTEINANTIVGAASLAPAELEKIKFVLEKREMEDVKFNLSGEVSFTKDYEKMRVVHLKMSDFIVTPSGKERRIQK